MTVASCPSCRENVTVPVDATPECIVRCPLCHEEFRLEAFLAQLPPALIVLRDDREATDQPATEKGLLWDDSSSRVLASLNAADTPVEAHDSVPAFDFTPGSAGDNVQEGGIGVTRRTGRRQKNSTVEVLKIVAGGLLAIPAAQLILWWFVPSDWKRDLLGIGPAVSRVVPWIVPQKFRAPEDMITREPSFEPGFDASSSPLQPRRARPRPSNGSATPLPGSGGQAPTHDADSVPPAADQATAETEPIGSLATPAETGQPSAVPTPTTEEPSAAELVQKSVPAVRGAPQSDLPALRAAFESALQASIAWDTSPDQSEQRRAELTAQFYAAFAKLGETVTYIVPTGDPAERDLVGGMQDVLLTFAQHPKKLAMIGNCSSQWLDQIDRPNQGIFLFGTVKQIQPGGEVFETELELGSLKKRTITVVSRLDPHPFYGSDDRVLMLGAIVLDPANNLRGYDGKESLVVMGGLPIVLKP